MTTADKEKEFKRLVTALDTCKSTQVDGYHLSAIKQELVARGYKRKEAISFQEGSTLQGDIYVHPVTKVRVDISAGNFLGAFTEMQISHE